MTKLEGISYKDELYYPCPEEEFAKNAAIISGLRDLAYEHLILELKNYPFDVLFVQTVRMEEDGGYLIEAGINCGKKKPRMLRLKDVSFEDTLKIFRQVCVDAAFPDDEGWEDVTREIFYKKVTLNIFKTAYKVVRENSKEIYKGFGFKHLSDATQYYVHPDNQSFEGTTTLCQPIGEALLLFASMLQSIVQGKGIGDYFFSADGSSVYLEITVPEDYSDNGVTVSQISRYRALAVDKEVAVAAYDIDDCYIPGDLENLCLLYKLLPVFMVLLGRDMEQNLMYRRLMEAFVAGPSVDTFVNLHEDFYQNHKMDEYDITYRDVSETDIFGWTSFSSVYTVIQENKKAASQRIVHEIRRFPESEFSEMQRSLIPSLSSEFVLPEEFFALCNALCCGDIISVLLHGPAGTGKTISCKLIGQNIGLPIMETINCTENLDEFVLGKFIPQEDRIIFWESYVTKAIRSGGAVVFEEINFAKPQYLAFLNSLLDDNGFVRLDNGEVVRRHPNFRFFATMNMGYFGTKELNQALYNRFGAVVEMAALSDEAILRMLTGRVPECSDMAEKILGVYHKIKKKIEVEELDVVISPRNLENWARLAKYEGYVKAAEQTLIPVAKCDRLLEEAMRGIILLYKWKS